MGRLLGFGGKKYVVLVMYTRVGRGQLCTRLYLPKEKEDVFGRICMCVGLPKAPKSLNGHFLTAYLVVCVFCPQTLAEIDKWGIDIFRIADLTSSRPLTAIAYSVFQVSNTHPVLL